MFGHQPFFFDSTKKTTLYFGTIFNELTITRNRGDGSVEIIDVPLTYGPKNKDLLRVDDDPNIQRDVAIILPRMSFELNNYVYDSDRKTGTERRFFLKDETNLNKVKRMYNFVPYDFFFSLYVYAKNIEDGHKILEQIIPFFSPSWTATVNMLPDMDLNFDMPITLQSVDKEDNYDGTYVDRRRIIWTLRFSVKSFFFCPIVSKPIIKISNTNFYMGNTSTTNTIFDRIKTTPGLDANGNPTSNSAVAIPIANVAIDDNWGYVVTYEDQND